MKSRALAFAVLAAAIGSLAVAAARSNSRPVVPGLPTPQAAAAGQVGLLQFLAACPCKAELDRVTEANARVGDLQKQLADVNRRLGDNQASQAAAQANLKKLRADFDKHLGGGVGSNSGTFVRGDDGREVRYNAQGQIETYQNGNPVPGTAKPSPFMSGLKSKIDAEEATLKKLQDERGRLEQEQQQASRDLAQATADAAAAAAAFKACLERCRATQTGSTAPGQTGSQTGSPTPGQVGTPVQTQSGSTTPAQTGSQAATPTGSATSTQTGSATLAQPGTPAETQSGSATPAQTGSGTATQTGSQAAPSAGSATPDQTGSQTAASTGAAAPARDLNWALEDRVSARLRLQYSFDTSTDSSRGTATVAASPGTTPVPADVAPGSSFATWGNYRKTSFRVGDTLEQRLEYLVPVTGPEYVPELGGPIVKDRLYVWQDQWGEPDAALGDSLAGLSGDNQRYNAALGGPIVRDRLWLWGSYGAAQDKAEAGPSGSNAPYSGTLFGSMRDSFFRARPDPGQGLNDRIEGKLTAEILPSRFVVSYTDLGTLSDIFAIERKYATAARVDDTPYVRQPSLFDRPPLGNLSGSLFSDTALGPHEFKGGTSYTENESGQDNLPGSYFFNTGSVSHELKFGASYRNAEVQSTSTFGGGSLLPGDQQWQFIDGFWTQTPSRGGAQVPSVGLEPEAISPRLGLNNSLGTERQTLLRESYSRFADRVGTSRESWRLADGVWQDNYLAGSALLPWSHLESDDIEPRSRLNSLASAMEAFPGQNFWQLADELATGTAGVGSTIPFNFHYFYYPDETAGFNSVGSINPTYRLLHLFPHGPRPRWSHRLLRLQDQQLFHRRLLALERPVGVQPRSEIRRTGDPGRRREPHGLPRRLADDRPPLRGLREHEPVLRPEQPEQRRAFRAACRRPLSTLHHRLRQRPGRVENPHRRKPGRP